MNKTAIEKASAVADRAIHTKAMSEAQTKLDISKQAQKRSEKLTSELGSWIAEKNANASAQTVCRAQPRPSTRKRCDQRRTSSVDMYQKPKTVCSAMAAIIALAGSTVLTLSGISSIAPIAGTDLRTERRKKRESFNCLRGIAGSL